MSDINYNKISHTHCFNQVDSPCGIKGKHRCCLCGEPVPHDPNEKIKICTAHGLSDCNCDKK